MQMKEASFTTPDALVKFINTATIPQAQIVQIIERAGRWIVFYYQ